ncbi:unnamed protein product, partial [Taenia asiatica]|uniref:Ig-like domain-containing protein n=1 Tax=Taenia asiatica TaxID=60517 RepID=A0A0R3W082_TAEAS
SVVEKPKVDVDEVGKELAAAPVAVTEPVKKSKALSSEEKPKKEKFVDEGGEEELKKRSFEDEAELKPAKAAEEVPEETKPISEGKVELLTETTDEPKKVSLVEEDNEIKTTRKRSKDESEGEPQQRRESVKGEAEGSRNNENLKDVGKDLPTSPIEEVKKKESSPAKSTAESVVKLMEGEKFQLVAKVPLDSRQMKNGRLWWTKDGKVFLDVDGVAPRTAKFTSRSTPKSPRSAEVQLVKKEPTDVKDAATYRLIGEPRIKRSFKSQETTYATIVVSVVEKPKSSDVVDEELKSKDTEALNVPQHVQLETDDQNQQEEVPNEDIPQGEVKMYEAQPKKEKNEDKTPKEEAEKIKSLEDAGERPAKDQEKGLTEEKESLAEAKVVVRDFPTPSGTVVKLKEGDKFQLSTSIPLDARQLKNNKLW